MQIHAESVILRTMNLKYKQAVVTDSSAELAVLLCSVLQVVGAGQVQCIDAALKI